MNDPEATQRFESLLSRVVVVRGGEAMAPKDIIELSMPGEAPASQRRPETDGLDPLARGPEITQIG